ncbi:MAG: alanine racemase [Bacteroidota bacterium]
MISTPTLLLDEQRCRRNIAAMAQNAEQQQVALRPHFKTHQSLEIGRWFKEYGVNKITVSSLAMAQYFSPEWNNITVAFPINVLEIRLINELAAKISLQLLVEDLQALQFLSRYLEHPVGIFIKIDVGYGRTGLNPAAHHQIEGLLDEITSSPKLNFHGFLAHAGHTYQCRSKAEIKAVHQQSKARFLPLREQYNDQFPDLILSLGDTPSCSVAADYSGIDEMRPGNFVFYDLTQARVGSNTPDQIAVAMACPIVALHPERRELVLYGGGVHFSKDRLTGEPEGTVWGRVVRHQGPGWNDVIPGMYLRSLSQEHGIVVVPPEVPFDFKVGDVLKVLPVHSCMAANAMKRYLTTDGRWIERL